MRQYNVFNVDPYGLIMLLMKKRGDQAHATRMCIAVKDGTLVMSEALPENTFPIRAGNKTANAGRVIPEESIISHRTRRPSGSFTVW